ncbi:MAG TPA: cellulose synthase, partial [Bauldia sp.]|nr:cellulose synthase [Bauldia sp.]
TPVRFDSDQEELEHCLRRVLALVGENPERPGLLETPARAAKATATDGPAPPADVATAPAPPAAAAPVDESALRYFARSGDTRRLNAEIARLKALHPGWTPPADPAAAPVFQDADLDAMWQLFSEGRYGEVAAAIAARQAREPTWSPPASLTELLEQANRRVRLTNASDAGQWNTVVGIAANTPSLLTCDYVDVLWRVAEAFAKTDRPDRATDAYRYVLENCDDAAERLATVQKAAALLPAADVAALMQLERGDEFAPIRDDLLRERIGRIAETPGAVADPADVKRLETLAAAATTAGDPLLLAWYDYTRGKAETAATLFQKALSLDPSSAKAAEGYTLALVALGQMAEAEAAGFDWNDASDDNRKAYLAAVVGLLAQDPPPKLNDAVLKRIVSVVTRVKDAAAGEQLGWYAYNVGQTTVAERWFEAVLKWSPDDEPAAYGLAVARLALKDRAGANEIIRAWRDRSDRIAKLAGGRRSDAVPAPDGATVTPAAVRTRSTAAPYFDNADPDVVYVDDGAGTVTAVAPSGGGGGGSGARCAGTAPVATLSPEAALSRGWCLMDLNRPVEAAAAFEIGMQSRIERVRSDAAYGASLAHLRSGVTDRASVAAAAALQPEKRRRELTVDILTQEAVAFSAEGRSAEVLLALDERARYAPETTDLMAMRAYAYVRLRQWGDAKRIFTALAAIGNPEGIRGLLLLQNPDGGLK